MWIFIRLAVSLWLKIMMEGVVAGFTFKNDRGVAVESNGDF